MSPGQRSPSSRSASIVAGRTSFNIMWHYAKVAERNPRVTHIISAPGRLRARCVLLQHRRAAGRRGCAPQHSAAHSSQARSAANIAPVLRLSRCGRPPWRRWLRRQPSANINVNRTGGCRPDGLR
ncbi:hypothetical protein C5E22_21890 [Pectobacterium parmentieri]|uniref:Uncharacterized protein n=1 Tax=Pectobacterium parmentieri TaxID=1905730 RepID=A0A8B3FHT7_PECPM|nr:hypothetical protein C5E24_22010 [Pectobacterium parmentieri]AYH20887.1 hypothetical protein C5E22_21890 [Pectobacterium parmentieri]AYH38450.1 hypothetical protein C5E17_21735 [Pectobacterium parmentieri]AZS58677.1 hypothetical protein C5E18_22420 [Pectobacterium parmentieri]RKO78224.1 hypothetical protein C5E00_16210 [Pectobacterium parmentieri]